jgi:putative restriction endonuclease
MNLYLGVTNCSWFDYLSAISPEDVNFWQPGGKSAFRVLPLDGIFLFKLKKPYNAIGGLGFFRAQTQLPLSLAWDAFGVRNGVPDLDHFRTIIQKYRGDRERNPTIGCIALTDPVFFRRDDWIPVPADWSTSIVQGKRYSTDTATGSALWQQVQDS